MVEYKSISRIGSRTINEDCVGMHQKGEEYGFFLADGLGGHGKGDLASQEAVKQAILEFEDGGSTEETMQRIFEQAQEKVLELQRQDSDSTSDRKKRCSVRAYWRLQGVLVLA